MLFGDVQLTSQLTRVKTLGGNLHNEYIKYETPVQIYKAVMGRKRNLCTKGDDVIYVGEEEVSLFIMTL